MAVSALVDPSTLWMWSVPHIPDYDRTLRDEGLVGSQNLGYVKLTRSPDLYIPGFPDLQIPGFTRSPDPKISRFPDLTDLGIPVSPIPGHPPLPVSRDMVPKSC